MTDDESAKPKDFLLDTMVLDKKRGAILALSMNKKRVVIIPHTPDAWPSMLEIYRIIVEQFDPKATIEILKPEAKKP